MAGSTGKTTKTTKTRKTAKPDTATPKAAARKTAAPTAAASKSSKPAAPKTAAPKTAASKAAAPKAATQRTSAGKTTARTGQRKTPTPAETSTTRKVAVGTLSIGAIVGAVAAAAFGLFKFRRGGDDAGHVPTDLMGDAHPGPEDRAIDAFRPDPTAPIPDSERDAFRPALAGASAPTLVKGQARENERLDATPS